MLRKYIFKNNVTGQEVVLPVTPGSFQIDRGVPVETVDLHGFGEYAMAGAGMQLFSETLEFMLPRHDYPFNQPGTNLDPYYYIEFFQLTSDRRQTCRFVISDTPTICDVLLENLQYGERDGTNDVYCVLTMHRWRPLGAVRTVGAAAGAAAAAGQPRTNDTPPTAQQSYTIRRGDTLSSICRKFYGDANLYPKLAAFNGIANPNMIYDGHTLKIPSNDKL